MPAIISEKVRLRSDYSVMIINLHNATVFMALPVLQVEAKLTVNIARHLS